MRHLGEKVQRVIPSENIKDIPRGTLKISWNPGSSYKRNSVRKSKRNIGKLSEKIPRLFESYPGRTQSDIRELYKSSSFLNKGFRNLSYKNFFKLNILQRQRVFSK